MLNVSTINNMISNQDYIGLFVVFSLVIFSILSWGIIINKVISYRFVTIQINKITEIIDHFQSLKDYYDIKLKKSDNPIFMILSNVIREFESVGSVDKIKKIGKQNFLDKIYLNLDVTKSEINKVLDSNLIILSITSSSSPFIGLLGTVIGIMNSFLAITSSKNTSLVAVAPGIAEALFATALGLFVAIPSLIFYNILQNKLEKINSSLSDISLKIYSNISTSLDKDLND